LLPEDPRLARWARVGSLERGLLLGGAGMALGIGLLAAAVRQWWAVDFGPLDYSHTMRWVIPGMMCTTLGFQTILFSFFLSVLGLRRQ
jgi:hypothetical protein